ncbi:hypothetical protein [Halalkalicoccus jeotgali]|uniref:Uncharacterized protein n=1 Tax=Halalkalicoccus jeotgali (strain DSM 18796 / CECT 7217 / JCM 14584 / KCTC 4019 / B3) TaxID=795797 RepID=D8JAR6_HALJB|nr:hypothetical protein [Halalkalicoccus jeotgali]ADJ14788.1 hypothetical protein HacjB3_07005 [Halalkalicoccus jeotgali B3]ELY39370.1 hypothetical protein C497_05412 [Halalkalicoccus jeotgali B3]
MTDGDGTERDDSKDEASGGSGRLGTLGRGALGAVAVVLGIVWIGRLAVGGPTLGGGLLFEVLPPLVLLYFGLLALRALYDGS